MYKIKKILFNVLIIVFVVGCTTEWDHTKSHGHLSSWKINTGNDFKYNEFQYIFTRFNINLERSNIDLPEIDADPVTVVVHKASQFEDYVLVEDTSLDVEGAEIGVNLKWLQNDLIQLDGRRALWRVLVAYKIKDKVHVYRGEVPGHIKVQGKKFNLDKFFIPDGRDVGLFYGRDDKFNARAIAIENLVHNKIYKICETIPNWNGKWQQNDSSKG
jgi:XTP/dITP diphosphohydrolase